MLTAAKPMPDSLLALDGARMWRACWGTEPDPWQQELLQCNSSRIVLNGSRQSGKSSVAATLTLRQLVFYPESLVLLVAPTLRQAGELIRKVKQGYQYLGAPERVISMTQLSMELANGARAVALPATEGTSRGFSRVSLLVLDEASRILDHAYFALAPVLAVSQGRCYAGSTPWGRRGWWYAAWESADWERRHITVDQCPRISRKFLEAERRAMGEQVFRQEYYGTFVDPVGSVFSEEAILAALEPEAQALYRQMGGADYARRPY